MSCRFAVSAIFLFLGTPAGPSFVAAWTAEGDQDFAGPPEPLADALPDATVKVLPGIDHFGLPKQFGFIDAALEFIDAVPDWS